MKAHEILERAIKLVCGQRQQDYGEPEINIANIADGWNIIIKNAEGKITPADVCTMMAWLKSCRLMSTPNHADSWVDAAGYIALGAQMALRESERLHTGPTKVGRTSPVMPSDLGAQERDFGGV